MGDRRAGGGGGEAGRERSDSSVGHLLIDLTPTNPLPDRALPALSVAPVHRSNAHYRLLLPANPDRVRKVVQTQVPLATFIVIAFFTVATMGLSNSSLTYLNYPTQVRSVPPPISALCPDYPHPTTSRALWHAHTPSTIHHPMHHPIHHPIHQRIHQRTFTENRRMRHLNRPTAWARYIFPM